MNKIAQLSADLKAIEVIEGSRPAFIAYYLLTKLASFLRRKSAFADRVLRRLIGDSIARSFVIRGPLGVFKVQPFDDSLTMASGYFEESMQDWLALPESKGVFIDVGANMGRYCMLAALKFGYERVYAFEPNPRTAKTCRENISLNGLEDRVRLFETGLGDEARRASFSADLLNKVGDHVVEDGKPGDTEVAIVSFDEWRSKEGLDAKDISFIKMDVEGYEWHALKGMRGSLAALKLGTVMMIEISKRYPEVAKMLEGAGFVLKERVHSDYLFVKSA